MSRRAYLEAEIRRLYKILEKLGEVEGKVATDASNLVSNVKEPVTRYQIDGGGTEWRGTTETEAEQLCVTLKTKIGDYESDVSDLKADIASAKQKCRERIRQLEEELAALEEEETETAY